MSRTLLAYSTVDGHTQTICTRLKQSLEVAGHAVQLHEIGGAPDRDLAQFAKIVIGASIRYGKHRPAVFDFVEAHRDVLGRSPSALFSVNVVARKPGKDTPETNPYVKTESGMASSAKSGGQFGTALGSRRPATCPAPRLQSS